MTLASLWRSAYRRRPSWRGGCVGCTRSDPRRRIVNRVPVRHRWLPSNSATSGDGAYAGGRKRPAPVAASSCSARYRAAASRHHQCIAAHQGVARSSVRRRTAPTEIIEVQIGYDGIVFANSKKSARPCASPRKQLFISLAVASGRRRWAAPSAQPVEDLAGHRQVAAGGERSRSWAAADLGHARRLRRARDGGRLRAPSGIGRPQGRTTSRPRPVPVVREDGGYIEAGENDNRSCISSRRIRGGRHLRLQLPRAERGQGAGLARSTVSSRLREHRGRLAIRCRGRLSST